jgi:hypothetical protein
LATFFADVSVFLAGDFSTTALAVLSAAGFFVFFAFLAFLAGALTAGFFSFLPSSPSSSF